MSLVVKVLKNGDLKEWDRFLLGYPHYPFHQSSSWTHFQNAIHWGNTVLGLFNGDTLVAGANVFQFSFPNKTNFLYLPDGPVLTFSDEDKLFEEWRALMPGVFSLINRGGELTTHIRMEPLIPKVPDWFLSNFVKAPYNLLPAHTQLIDLTQPQEEILAHMKQKGRYNLKQAQKMGVTVERVTTIQKKDIVDFYELYKETFERNKFHGKQLPYFEHFFKRCAPMLDLFFASKEGKRIAAGVLIRFGARATYLYGASSSDSRAFNAPYLLQWTMISYAKEKELLEYDFWGISSSLQTTHHPWYGMTRFKKNLGGFQVDLIGAYDHVLNKEAYQAFVKQYES